MGLNTIYSVKRILENEMKRVSNNINNGIVDNLSFGVVRQKAENIGLFNSSKEALFWFNDNRPALHRIYLKLNKIYKLPNF